MAMSLFGGRSDSLFDPFPFGSIIDPFEFLDPSPALTFARDARAIAATKVDWVETADAHLFKADLPRLTKKDIKVQVVDDRTMEISGELKKEEEKTGDKWHHIERSHGRFLRRFRLPENVKADGITAQEENGVLTVRVPKIPKIEPQTHARTVDIA